MESKAADGSRTSVSKLKEGSWWRWSHGKSGLTASSSHFGSLNDPLNHVNSKSHSKPAAAASPLNGLRWQKRTTRTPKEESVSLAVAWSTSLDPWTSSSSPQFFSATASPAVRSSRASVGSFQKKPAALSLSSRGNRDNSSKKPAVEPSSSSSFMFWTRNDKRAASSEVSGSMAKSKRSGTRKDRRSAKNASAVISNTRATRVLVSRTPPLLSDGKEDTEMRAPDANTNVFAFPTPPNKINRRSSLSFQSVKGAKADKSLGSTGPVFDFKEDCLETRQLTFPPLSPSAASTASTTSSFHSLSFSKVDPLVHCARAVLQDCIRKRQMEQSNARKRSIEDEDGGGRNVFGWQCDAGSKHKDHGNMSPGSSSSSDDELSQLSSMDQSFGADKSDRGCSSKLAREEMYRQILVGDYDLSSSPDFQCLSPLIEEKGLPIEVRYQLPLALGTANETSKECTICQLRYGIGDHIVTLPCQHFFHACCVDKWLWNHTSCPLCRTEVILDQKTEPHYTKHNFTECSPVDQERIRRQLRSSSQHAGFRPVVPVEIDQLELEVSRMAIDEDLDVEDEPSYLICPTPHLATNAQDDYAGTRSALHCEKHL